MAGIFTKLQNLDDVDINEDYSDVYNSGYYPYAFTFLAFAIFCLLVMYEHYMSRGEDQ